MSRTTELTLFSTMMITITMLLLYAMILSEINSELTQQGLGFMLIQPRALHLGLFIPATSLAYLASALIIDKTLNPIRLMIYKVNELGEMNFSQPLVINTGDEELQEYVSAFNRMSETIELYIERQKRFVSDASHELATPITVINGHADLLLRRRQTNPELVENSLNIIKSEILRMDDLVESLLMLARSDSKKQPYAFEEVNISNMLADGINEATAITPHFTFEADIEENISAQCDEYAIRRLLRIIISNAVKYSDKEKLLQIRAYTSPEAVHISIKDSGIGIAPEHLPYIFQRFYRVDPSRSKKTGSSGLGLAIAKEIIDAHSAEIKVKSQTGEGTEVEIFMKLSF